LVTVALWANGLNLNSNGSKAQAMGGAFVGLADDFSAIYWNPAGITQLDATSIGFYLTDIIPNGGYQFTLYGIDATTAANHYISGSLGFYTRLSDKFAAGVYFYIPSALGAEWKGEELMPLAGGYNLKWKSFFAVATLSPAIAYQINDMLSVGGSLNLSYGMLNLEQPGAGQYEEKLNGFAFGATIGIMAKPMENLSLGLTVKTPVKATLSGDVVMSGAGLLGLGLSTTQTAEREATIPMWLGVGVSYQPLEKLTVTGDIQYTNWAALEEISVDYNNDLWDTIFGPDAKIELKWKDALMFRLGLQYQVTPCVAARAGYYYDPGPAPKETLNILLPQFTYHWLTLGVGWTGKNIKLDAGFEYGMGQEVTILPGEGEMPGEHSMTIVVPTVSLTYYLDKRE
jgi:long-chain fatty acid transport protein